MTVKAIGFLSANGIVQTEENTYTFDAIFLHAGTVAIHAVFQNLKPINSIIYFEAPKKVLILGYTDRGIQHEAELRRYIANENVQWRLV
jgi:hypothetical protein